MGRCWFSKTSSAATCRCLVKGAAGHGASGLAVLGLRKGLRGLGQRFTAAAARRRSLPATWGASDKQRAGSGGWQGLRVWPVQYLCCPESCASASHIHKWFCRPRGACVVQAADPTLAIPQSTLPFWLAWAAATLLETLRNWGLTFLPQQPLLNRQVCVVWWWQVGGGQLPWRPGGG